MVTAQVFGTEALIAKFKAAEAAIPAAKPFHLRACGDAIQNNIQLAIAAKLQMRTGRLWDSVRVFGETKNGISVGTGKNVPYTQALEFGSRPHEIWASGISGSTRQHTEGDSFVYSAPGGASMLHFTNRYGEEVFARYVNHPGNQPYRFVYSGAMASWGEISILCMSYLREVFGVPL
jgi:hypothetical protein